MGRFGIVVVHHSLADGHVEGVVAVGLDLGVVVRAGDKAVGLHGAGRGRIAVRVDIFAVVHADIAVDIPVGSGRAVG